MSPRKTGWAVGLVALAAIGCGPRPVSEPPIPVGPAPRPPRRAAAGEARPVLVGQMCPTAAAGRPAVRPLFLRAGAWTDRADEVAAPVARRGARQFSVLGWNGRRAGLFSVVGAAALDGVDAAIGSYAGRSPCEKPRGAGSAGERDPECVAALRDCGLALSVLEAAGGFEARPVEEDPDPAELQISGGCVQDGKLLVDIDKDGAQEAFPAAGFVAEGGPAAEVESIDTGGAQCEPRFAIRAGLSARPEGEVDLIGVADLDADGRAEVIVAYRSGGRHSWALYAAVASAARLDRMAVATVWSR